MIPYTVGAGILNIFRIPMVALRLVFQWCSVMNKMAAILSQTIRNQNKILFGFPMVIAITNHSKTKVGYSNVFRTPMFDIQALTVNGDIRCDKQYPVGDLGRYGES